MESEELICEQCDKHWQRTKARGRKPKLCPTCIASSSPILVVETDEDIIENIPIAEEPPPEKTLYKPNTKWICHSCGAFVKTGVGINLPPTHSCKKRLKKIYPLEKLE